MSTALTIDPSRHTSITESRLTPNQLVAQRNAVIEAMQKVMKVDVDYGVIPGTPKPTLYKPGSEKILSMFHLAAEPRVEDLSTPDCIRYRVFVTITHAPTGVVLGTGIGEASSAESKYQWRRIVCEEEWLATPEDRRRLKWAKGKDGAYSTKQVRAEMDDVANTILKMAKKRAQIDATLTCTAASDMFSQDIEDLKDAGLDPNIGETTPAQAEQRLPSTLQPKQQPAPQFQPPAHPQAQQQTQPEQAGHPVISEGDAKRFWAVAINRTNDYKAIMDYLRGVHGITNKAAILQSRLTEAMKWAETGAVE